MLPWMGGPGRASSQKLLEALAHETNRNAHYYCVIGVDAVPDDPQPIVCEAEWHGEIVPARGHGGFGYDPLFFDPRVEENRASSATKKTASATAGRRSASAAAPARGG